MSGLISHLIKIKQNQPRISKYNVFPFTTSNGKVLCKIQPLHPMIYHSLKTLAELLYFLP